MGLTLSTEGNNDAGIKGFDYEYAYLKTSEWTTLIKLRECKFFYYEGTTQEFCDRMKKCRNKLHELVKGNSQFCLDKTWWLHTSCYNSDYRGYRGRGDTGKCDANDDIMTFDYFRAYWRCS